MDSSAVATRKTRAGTVLRLLAAAGLALCASPALAEEPTESVEWRMPPGCPSPTDADTTGRGPTPQSRRRPVDAVVEIDTSTDAIWRARVTTPGGQREVVADSCRAVVEAAKVIVGLSISAAHDETDSAAMPSRPAPKAAATEPPLRIAPPAAPPRDSVSRSAASDRDTQSVRPGIGARALAEVGSLPGGALGLAIPVALSRGAWRAEAHFAWFFPRGVDLGGAKATFGFWKGGLGACRSVGTPAFLLCGGAEAGRMSAESENVARPGEGDALWLALDAGPSVRLPFSRWTSLRLDARAIVPLLRNPFAIEGVGELHRPAPVGGQAGLGIDVSL